MNEKIRELMVNSGFATGYDRTQTGRWILSDKELEKFAELIVRECARLNRLQSYELMGVITDVEEGDGFDDVCLNTVKRVAEHLAKDLKEHFGVER